MVVRQKCGIGKISLWCKLRSSYGSTCHHRPFTDTDLQKRARKIMRVSVGEKLHRRAVTILYANLPAEFARYDAQQTSDYLALNAGLVAMELGIGFDGPRHWNQYYFGI